LALASSGRELPDRIRNRASVLLDRFSSPRSQTLHAENFGDAVSRMLPHHQFADPNAIECHLTREQARLDAAPFPASHNGTATLGRLCYQACRALRPASIIETGVAYGVTSAYILQALNENGAGQLHSIDLPPIGHNRDSFVGLLVPPSLKSRWDLRIGAARKLLPQLLRETAPDIFIHDSLHTYAHMKWELELALTFVRPGGLIIADDIEGNRAFEQAARHPSVESSAAIRQDGKTAICGILRKRLAATEAPA
jgi:predicted O-methyltransferase YrrM